ncbi:MAG TPA: SDR family oxidoreductase [Candidatus Bathyarchaeia archaeon]|nr:SDR family oxidoreductase [Candidatus Bathyarchaeia archaeon]
MELGLKDKVALVPASSKGIGLGVAKVLAAEGCKVVISSRNQDSISKASDTITRETGNKNVFPVKADLTRKSDIDLLANQATSKFGTVDILAYNTGPPKPGTFADLSDTDWDNGVKLLLMSAVWLTKQVIPGMLQKKWGRLIYFTSSALRQPVPNLVLSNTVRLSLAGLSKSLALEYASRGITSNGIMQGHILTDRQRQVAQDVSSRTGKSLEEAMKQMLQDVPAQRYGLSEEVGYLVAFLASEKASYINGTMLAIDGGLIRSVF